MYFSFCDCERKQNREICQFATTKFTRKFDNNFNIIFHIFCRTASRTLVTFEVSPKLVSFEQAQYHCDDYLYLTDNAVQTNNYYCSENTQSRQYWNDDLKTVLTVTTLGVRYRANAQSRGGKFWLQVKGIKWLSYQA